MNTKSKIMDILGQFNNIGWVDIFEKPKTITDRFLFTKIENCIAEIEVLGLSGSGDKVNNALKDAGFKTVKNGLTIYIVKNETQLKKGRKVELEHRKTIKKIRENKLTDIQAAELIAKDHLKELPDYYDRLERMEKGIEGVKALGEIVDNDFYKIGAENSEKIDCNCFGNINGIADLNIQHAPLPSINPTDYKNQFEINQAIEQLIKSKSENAKSYSLDEKQFIRLYSGSGGLGNQGATGKGILYEFFTPEYICDLMYELAKAHGYDGGNILEPSCGTGELIRPATNYNKVTAFEINPISAAVTQILYPGVIVYSDYFETAFMQQPRFSNILRYPNKTWLTSYPFSMVIGNPPYGRYQSLYSRYFDKKLFKQVEIFFIIQGLQLLKKSGLLVYIQSSNFLRNGDKYDEAKKYIDDIAEFVDAYRLPSVFKFSEVPTDIIILRKK